jgi:hypothetical protein
MFVSVHLRGAGCAATALHHSQAVPPDVCNFAHFARFFGVAVAQ